MRSSTLSLAPRVPALPAADRGPMLDARQVARGVWSGRVSSKWVIQKMRSIGFKPGRDWLWYQAEAEKWRDDYIEAQRKRA